MWRRLRHKNIIPLLGITIQPLQLVSEWMSGGDLTDYIEQYPNTNRLGLVGDPPYRLVIHLSSSQLREIAEGLNYLHHCNIIHGDLKGVSDR